MPDDDSFTRLMQRINNDYHKPDEATAIIHDLARDAFLGFARQMASTWGPHNTRETSLALTALEQCSFWVHANIARNARAS